MIRTWLERHRYYIDFAIASLARRKVKNVSLMLCYAMIIFLITSVLFLSASLRHEAVALLEGSPEIIVQRVVAGRYAPIPLGYIPKIQKIRGVRRLEGRLWGYYFHPAAGANYTVMVDENDESVGDDKALVGSGVLRTWTADDGDLMYFKAFDGSAVSLTAERAFGRDTELITADLILLSESNFRRIFGLAEGVATDLAASVRNPKEWQTVVEKILQIAPDVRVITREEIKRTYSSLFDWRSGYVIVMLTGAVLAFLIFAADKAAGLSATEKKEIAVLKAVGWETSDVLLLKFWEGLMISLGAFLVGVISAYFHVYFFPAPLFEHALKGWSVLYPKFKPIPVFSAYDLAVVFAFTVVPYGFITVVPAWKAAVTDPDAVMRSF